MDIKTLKIAGLILAVIAVLGLAFGGGWLISSAKNNTPADCGCEVYDDGGILSDIGQLNSVINSLLADVAADKETVSGDISNLITRLNNLQGEVGGLDGLISQLQTALSLLDGAGDIEAVLGALSDISGDIAALQNRTLYCHNIYCIGNGFSFTCTVYNYDPTPFTIAALQSYVTDATTMGINISGFYMKDNYKMTLYNLSANSTYFSFLGFDVVRICLDTYNYVVITNIWDTVTEV